MYGHSSGQQADRRAILFATWWAYAGFYFCRKVFYVVKKDLGDALGFAPEVLGEIGAAYLIAYAIGQFTVSYLSRYITPKKMLLSGMAISIMANIGFSFASSQMALTGLIVANGFAQSTGWPSLMGILVNWTDQRERGWLMGLWATCYQIGSVMASAWAAYWLSQGGYALAFWMSSGVLFIVFILNLLFTRVSPNIAMANTENIVQADAEEAIQRTTDGLWMTVACVGLFYFGVKFVRYALWSWTPYFLQANFGLAGDDAGYLSTLFDLFGFAGVMSAGFISDKFFASQRSGVAFWMIVGLLCGTCALYFFGTSSLLVFSIIFAAIGFCLFGPDALLTGAGVLDLGGTQKAAQIAGFVNGLGSLGAVSQEIVIARVYGQTHDLNALLRILTYAALLSFVALTIQRFRVARGQSRF